MSKQVHERAEKYGLNLTDLGTLVATSIFLGYTITYAAAWPRTDLIVGIVFESLIFVSVLGWRIVRRNSVDMQAKRVVISQLSSAIPFANHLKNGWRWLYLTLGAAISCAVLIDLVALISVRAGNVAVGEAIYTNIPTTYLVTTHPALSAEVLAGMYAESGQFDKAQRIYMLIYDVRKKVFGEKNEMMVSLLSHFGDFYYRQKKYELAEESYEQSIRMSKEIHSAYGYGRPMTGLANCYREAGQWRLAEAAYGEALRIRSTVFGPKSEKALETLKEYLKLAQLEGAREQEMQLSAKIAEAEAIRPRQKEDSGNGLVFMLAGFVVSYALFGNYGFLTRLVTRQLQSKVDNCTATPHDLQNLRLLCAYQGIKTVDS